MSTIAPVLWKVNDVSLWLSAFIDDENIVKRFEEAITIDSVQKQYTRFLLEIREQHILPQNVIHSITHNVISLLDIVQQLIEETSAIAHPTCTSQYPSTIGLEIVRNTITDVTELIKRTTKTEYHFVQLCEKYFNYCAPREIILSTTDTKKQSYYYVPIKESLQNILSKEGMIPLLRDNIEQQQQQITRDADLLYSFRQGTNGTNIDQNSFLVQLYTDGVGLTNPIGPKKDQHKITLVYFVLEDIPDIFKSMLQCISLVAICYTKYLNDDDTMKQFYAPIVKDMNDLQTNGLTVPTVSGNLKFTFTVLCADNLASNDIGGFQQSFSSGKFCRRCHISYDERTILRTELTLIPRDETTHNQHLQQIMNDPNHQPINGVVHRSPLEDLDGFHATKSLPPDVMHDYFEGTNPYIKYWYFVKFYLLLGACTIIILAMLKEASSSNPRLLTYGQVQDRMENFVYGSMDAADKPPPIQVKHLQNGRIVGSAIQKFTLFRLFPIMFCDITLRLKTFQIYLKLCEMLEIVLALPARKSWLPYLETLSIEFQCLMATLLPDKMVPKIHFVTEYGTVIDQCGPAVRYWCMRYEGKHAYFKKIALHANNFKNMPKTLAQRHQLRHCLLLSQCQFLKSYNHVSGVKKIEIHQLSQAVKTLLGEKYGLQLQLSVEQMQQCSKLNYNHLLYQQATIYVHNLLHVEETPVFFQIVHILKINQQWTLVVDQLITIGYDENLCCYELKSDNLFTTVLPQELKYYHKGLDLYEISGQEDVDGATLLLMNTFETVSRLIQKYKLQLLFLNEYKKLFPDSTDEEKAKQNVVIDQKSCIVDLTSVTPSLSSTASSSPTLLSSASSSPILSWENLNNNKQLYPSSKQYECIARGIINCLRIEVNDKEMNSWRETMKARFKRERKQVADINEEVKIHKEKYSRLASGRPVKKQELTLLSERDPEKKIVLQINQDEKDEELEEVTLKMKQEIEKERPDLQMVLALWRKSLRYRRDFIRVNKISDVLTKFPGYRIPVHTPVNISIPAIAGIKLASLFDKLVCTSFVFDATPIRLVKVLCQLLEESWKNEPSSPQPTIRIHEDKIQLFVDWTIIVEPETIEDAVYLWIALYNLFELKFVSHSRVARLLKLLKEHHYDLENEHQSNITTSTAISLVTKNNSTESSEQQYTENKLNNLTKKTQADGKERSESSDKEDEYDESENYRTKRKRSISLSSEPTKDDASSLPPSKKILAKPASILSNTIPKKHAPKKLSSKRKIFSPFLDEEDDENNDHTTTTMMPRTQPVPNLTITVRKRKK
ncbi:unnamed protein product [Didymodactylos carnosus]|uniref:Uncharacterized protein n=1 Tax=Didymodactylos carnosus TaxID=1234261 RepID=A0A8S2I9M7_9BILA|nr:unnamed protein product [Didymodactylos carnosus]CAF3726912.1 unnamed protein product [Didymodactylos carnosus]